MDNKPNINEFLDKQVESQRQFEKRLKANLPNSQTIGYWLSLFTAFLLIGGLAFASVNFNPEEIFKISFWIPIGITSGAVYIVIWATSNEYLTRYTRIDQDIATIKKNIFEKSKTESFEKLPEYLARKNMELKIQAWKELQKKRLARVEARATDKDLAIELNGSESEKLENKYINNKKRLQRLLTDEYIQENLPYLKVKVIQYTYAMILAGTKGGHNKSSFEVSLSKQINMEAIYSILSRTIMLVAISVLIFTEQSMSLGAVIKLFGNLVILATAYFRALVLAKDLTDIVKEQSVERTEILNDYYRWYKTIEIKKEEKPLE